MWDSPAGWFGGKSRDRPVDEAAALKISAFYRAVDLRSDSIGRLPVHVKDLTTREEDAKHPLGRVLWERPNEAMTPFVYKKLVEYVRSVPACPFPLLQPASSWLQRYGGKNVECKFSALSRPL